MLDTNELTIQAWMDELATLQQPVEDVEGMTVRELCKFLKKSERWVLNFLRDTKEAGWLKVGARSEQNIVGRTYRVNTYSFRSPKMRKNK